MLPADSLLNGVRNTQIDVGITSTITDDDVEAMKGKYMKDLAPQSDPFGGVFEGNAQGEAQDATETADESENGAGGTGDELHELLMLKLITLV